MTFSANLRSQAVCSVVFLVLGPLLRFFLSVDVFVDSGVVLILLCINDDVVAVVIVVSGAVFRFFVCVVDEDDEAVVVSCSDCRSFCRQGCYAFLVLARNFYW